MKEIKNLVGQMREELHDAGKYAKQAVEHKDDDHNIAGMYYDLAKEELHHVDMLHEQAVTLIRRFKDSGREAPAAMQAIWDWEHQMMIEHRKEVEIILEMFSK